MQWFGQSMRTLEKSKTTCSAGIVDGWQWLCEEQRGFEICIEDVSDYVCGKQVTAPIP
jgi:hypothetical protein